LAGQRNPLPVGDNAVALLQELQAKRDEILRIASRHSAKNVRVFGSVVRGEETDESDVDFLVDFDPGHTLFDRAGLLDDLQALLGRKVDVVTPAGIYWILKRRILKEARPL
jgi:hypothetical protein